MLIALNAAQDFIKLLSEVIIQPTVEQGIRARCESRWEEMIESPVTNICHCFILKSNKRENGFLPDSGENEASPELIPAI